jgi:Holliday junction resolvase
LTYIIRKLLNTLAFIITSRKKGIPRGLAMGSHFEYGQRKEREVAARLRSEGYNTKLSPGSRGASDMVARRGTKTWVIQVKASRSCSQSTISSEGRRRLKIQAQKIGATPVLACVNRGRVRYFSVRTGKRLKVT